MTVHRKFKEIFAVFSVIMGLILLQWRLWVTNELMVSHDSIIWYGIFQYFVDSLHHGVFPFWNAYMNCGEIFFLVISNLHLLEPPTIFLILIGKLLKIELLTLYHYDLLLRYIIFVCGSYCFFRYVSKYRISAFIAFASLCFSSLCTSYLRQHAFILAFYLFPWILFFAVNFFEQKKLKFLLLTAFSLGIIIPSYHSMFILVALTVLLAFLFLFKALPKPTLKPLQRNHKLALSALFIFLLLTISILPLYHCFKHQIIPTARIFEAPCAAHSFPADFSNLLNPYWFKLHFFNWGYISEAFLYIGLIPLFLAIIGLCFSRHKYKLPFMATTGIIVLLMLGDQCFVYPLFSKFFPFFSIIRNTHTFNPFFIFCLIYFSSLGADLIFESFYTSKIKINKKAFILIAVFIAFLSLLLNYRFFTLLPSLIGKYNILSGSLSLTTKGAVEILQNNFYKSAANLFLFAAGITIIFFLLKKPKININIKCFTVIAFVLADLVLFNRSVYKLVTIPRISPDTIYAVKAPDNNLRIPVIEPKFPFYAFAPAMLKIFTAGSTKIPWVTTHFYEMKHFYEFINTQQITDEVKKILTGVSVPKLRLVSNAIVLPHNKIIEELKKTDARTAKQIIFIEKHLPSKYSHLEKPFQDSKNRNLPTGKITTESFNTNEIVITVNSAEDSLLYYSDGYNDAWKAFLNNEEIEIYKTNLAFKSIIVNKGPNRIRFVYNPRLYKFSLFCYFAGLLGLPVIFICGMFRKKRKPYEKT